MSLHACGGRGGVSVCVPGRERGGCACVRVRQWGGVPVSVPTRAWVSVLSSGVGRGEAVCVPVSVGMSLCRVGVCTHRRCLCPCWCAGGRVCVSSCMCKVCLYVCVGCAVGACPFAGRHPCVCAHVCMSLHICV